MARQKQEETKKLISQEEKDAIAEFLADITKKEDELQKKDRQEWIATMQ